MDEGNNFEKTSDLSGDATRVCGKGLRKSIVCVRAFGHRRRKHTRTCRPVVGGQASPLLVLSLPCLPTSCCERVTLDKSMHTKFPARNDEQNGLLHQERPLRHVHQNCPLKLPSNRGLVLCPAPPSDRLDRSVLWYNFLCANQSRCGPFRPILFLLFFLRRFFVFFHIVMRDAAVDLHFPRDADEIWNESLDNPVLASAAVPGLFSPAPSPSSSQDETVPE